jgi:hypothetical protein
MAGILLILATAAVAEDNKSGKADSGVTVSGAANEGRRVRLGGVMLGASYTRGYPYYPYSYPYYSGFGPWAGPYWGLYDPFWYSPWIHPSLYSGWTARDQMGEIKIDTAAKTAAVYVDDAFAGTVKDLKSIWLRPGAYNIEVRDYGGRTFRQRVYVLTGKTLKMRPELRAAAQEDR